MIDTHCHLLWRLDDGPRTATEAIDLARTLVVQGVVAALCTPHYSHRFPVGVEAARARLVELRRNLHDLDIPLETALAAEVARPLALTSPVDELRQRSVGEFLVVELDPASGVGAPVRILERLLESGLRPILAHPERAVALRRDYAPFAEVRAGGALVQVVLSSLAGRRGRTAGRAGWALLDAGMVDLIATDAHSARGSAAKLAEILAGVTARYGESATRQLTVTAPSRVLSVAAPSG